MSESRATKPKPYTFYDQYGNNYMPPVGPVALVPLRGSSEMVERINRHLYERRKAYRLDEQRVDPSFLREDYRVQPEMARYETGEGRCILRDSVRGHDIFIVVDVLNHSIHYKLFGQTKYMSPDEHYQDLKRAILALSGKARRVNVIMPFLYDSRQHHRNGRESLDCAFMLEELQAMGVSNIFTFDAHDPRVSNSMPMSGFENIPPTYQFVKALARTMPELEPYNNNLMIISPDEGALTRSMYYSSVLGSPLGTFYKRRDYTRIVDGRNPILKHEFLGDSAEGKDVLIIDDMIASGDSMLDICRSMKELGARNVYCAATFGLFTSGLDRFNQAYEQGLLSRVFTTNLIYCSPELKAAPWYHEVDMSKFIALLVDAVNHDSSISSFSSPTEKIEQFFARRQQESPKA